MKNSLIVLVTRLAITALSPLPGSLLAKLGRALGAVAWFSLRGSRGIADRNLALAFPSADRRRRKELARAAFVTLGGLLGETLARLSPRATYPAPLPFDTAESEEALADARARGRGVMLLSAHLGPYEDVARSLLAHGVPLLAVTKAAYDPRLDFVFSRLRRGLPTVARDEAGAAMRIVRHLRRGDVLGVPMDLASRVPSVSAPFFGAPARTPVGPARIALRTGAAVVVCTAVRAPDGSYALKVTAIPTDNQQGAQAEQALVARINEELCARIRALPEAWPWMHARFGPSPGRAAAPISCQELPAAVRAVGETLRVSGLPTEETR